MPVEDQVVQVYAATNGYLDRIVVDRVGRFLGDLSESVRSNEPELLKKIADGDWSDGVQDEVAEAVNRFAEDFGYDLDEEGHPLEDESDDGQRNGRAQRDGQRDGGRSESGDDSREQSDNGTGSGDREEQAQPA